MTSESEPHPAEYLKDGATGRQWEVLRCSEHVDWWLREDREFIFPDPCDKCVYVEKRP